MAVFVVDPLEMVEVEDSEAARFRPDGWRCDQRGERIVECTAIAGARQRIGHRLLLESLDDMASLCDLADDTDGARDIPVGIDHRTHMALNPYDRAALLDDAILDDGTFLRRGQHHPARIEHHW
ncbi:hypothetical protein GCM10017612_24980 [Novosphingobium resinovorum]|nr:hypothetical protein GCM10017612_24980 [Novosphingobium resinovorum]